jgi:hypothetical protein
MSLKRTAQYALSCLISISASALLSACGPSGSLSGDDGGAAIRPEGSEKPYNSTPITYTGSTVTIASQAQFIRWNDTSAGLTTKTTMNIRYAEVHIYNNSTGALVQAGETSGTTDTAVSNISMVIPRTAGTYRLEVHSRADNNYYKASVLNNPYDKQYYKISTTFTLAGTESGTLGVSLAVAPYNGTMEAAAFNILNDILIANEYLRAHANGSTTAGTADYCPASICSETFTVAPKVQVYWSKGLTPAAYYGNSASPISFFVPKSGGGIYEGLYILGGVEGDVCTDTDHYDNSVILHEYGHFLEHAFGQSDSPGGSHNGNRVIDPRLAWSEGWADFFQAAALGRTFYRDTSSNADCFGGARLSFNDFNLETMTSGQDSVSESLTGEGNFREISIARMLYDTITGPTQASPYNSNSDGTAADLGFAVVWDAFKSLTNSAFHVRNVGHMNDSLHTSLVVMGASYLNAWKDDSYSDTSKPLVHEKQRHDIRDFGLMLNRTAVTHGNCPASSFNYPTPDWVITSAAPKADRTDQSGFIVWSDLFNTNDMYMYFWDGTAAHATIRLKYKKLVGDSSGITNPWDLDLYVYKDDFVFLSNSDIVNYSEGSYPETTADAFGYNGRETITLSGSAGFYFINVKAYFVGDQVGNNPSPRGAGVQYYLELSNGEQLCPP